MYHKNLPTLELLNISIPCKNPPDMVDLKEKNPIKFFQGSQFWATDHPGTWRKSSKLTKSGIQNYPSMEKKHICLRSVDHNLRFAHELEHMK